MRTILVVLLIGAFLIVAPAWAAERSAFRFLSCPASDGTATPTELAHAIYREGLKHVTAGAHPLALKRGIEKAAHVVIEELRRIRKPVLYNRQTLALPGSHFAGGDREIGDLIAEAMEKVGRDGVITVKENKTAETTIEVVEGMQFDRGYLSPYFVTDAKRSRAIIFENPIILLHRNKISTMKDLLPILEQSARLGRPLVIIAKDVEGEALAALVVNKLRGTLQIAAVKAPGFGDRRKEILHDIATLTGAQDISKKHGIKLENLLPTDFGRAKKITIDKERTTIVGGAGKRVDIEARKTQIREQIDGAASGYDREKLEERLAKLAGGVAVIKVGAATEVEMKEKKQRVEDALNATRAAVEEGIVPGGGTALLSAAQVLKRLQFADMGEQAGANIIRRALTRGSHRRSASTQDHYAAHVIVPAKVALCAIQNAARGALWRLMNEPRIAEELKRGAEGQAGAQRKFIREEPL
ncbi:MAG: chaperonin GroEL [Parcubacteria group bacterium]|nr:chaperonin GroEL [Parcubacteria group bacterium]